MKRLLLLVCLTLVLIGVVNIPAVTKQTPKSDGIPLEPPIFVAKAVEIKAIRALPKDRAGFSAYVRIDGSKIDLQKVAEVLNQVEDVGDNYLVGYFKWRYKYHYHPLHDWWWTTGFFKIHVYVDKDGWIVAYIDKDDPSALAIAPTKNTWIISEDWYKRIDVGEGLTLLEAIRIVCNATGINYDSIKNQIKYYDFEHPTANRVVLFWKEFTNDNDALHFKVPDGSTVYEVSWMHTYDCCDRGDVFVLDNSKSFYHDYDTPSWGFFNESYISTNAHSISQSGDSNIIIGVAIIYKE